MICNDCNESTHTVKCADRRRRCDRCFGVWSRDRNPTNLKPRGIKAPLHLLPASAQRCAAAAFEDGARKYADWNWRDQTENVRDVYTAALLRHVMSFADPGESDYADDSHIHHLAHARACIDILLDRLGVDYPAKDPQWTNPRSQTSPKSE